MRCPAEQPLVFLRTVQDKKKWGTAERRQYRGCAGCAYAAFCCKNPEKARIVSRDQYEDDRERLRRRMDTEEGREIYKRRKYTVGPRIGHIKHSMGMRRFLRRGIAKVRTERIMACSAVTLGILLRRWDQVVTTL